MIYRAALVLFACLSLPAPLRANSPFAGPWHGMKSYRERKELGEFHLEVEFSSTGLPILMGQEIGAVGEAFAQHMDSELRVIEITALERKPNSVTMEYTIAGVPRAAAGARINTGVRLHTRRLQYTLAGDVLTLDETDSAPEGSRLRGSATLTRGLHRSVLAGPWVGLTDKGRVRVRFGSRGFPIIDGAEVVRIGQAVGAAEVVGLNVSPRKVELTLKTAGGTETTTWAVDDWMRLQETGAHTRAYTREYRTAGKWEGPTIDKDGKTIAKQVFAFDHDGIPVLNGERRTKPGTTFLTVPGLKDAGGIGMETHILRALGPSADSVYYQVRYETWIKVDTLFVDHDHYFVPRADRDDVVDFRIEYKGKLLHNGTLKRVAEAPEIPQALLPVVARPPALDRPSALQKVAPVKLVAPSQWTGTWLGTLTLNDKTTREDYFEFTPRGHPLFGYREVDDIRQTVALEKVGQTFAFATRLRDVTVTARQLNLGADRIAYTADRVERAGKIEDKITIDRIFSFKQDAVTVTQRFAPPRKPVETAQGTLERLPAFGGFWKGDVRYSKATSKPISSSVHILDGGRPVYFQSYGPGSNRHRFELAYVGQEFVSRLPNGGLFRVVVRELDTTPFRAAYVVETTRGSLDPAQPGEKEFVLCVMQRTGRRLQFFERHTKDGKFTNEQPYYLGTLDP